MGVTRAYLIPGEDLPLPIPLATLFLGLLCLAGVVSQRVPQQVANHNKESPTGVTRPEAPDSKAEVHERPRSLCPPLFQVSFAPMQAVALVESRELDILANWLLRHPQSALLVDGFADGFGTKDRNLDLSQRRAFFVARLFMAKGIAADRLLIRGFGFDKTVVDPSLLLKRKVRLSVPGYGSKGHCPSAEVR